MYFGVGGRGGGERGMGWVSIGMSAGAADGE